MVKNLKETTQIILDNTKTLDKEKNK